MMSSRFRTPQADYFNKQIEKILVRKSTVRVSELIADKLSGIRERLQQQTTACFTSPPGVLHNYKTSKALRYSVSLKLILSLFTSVFCTF